MLSPGGYYDLVPKEIGKNILWRLSLLDACREDTSYRAEIIEACRKDILFYVNAFVWTYDPRLIQSGKAPMLPFVTYPYQDRAFIGGYMPSGERVYGILECIEEGRDLIIEKSRDMGASWMSLTAMEWLWHFKGGTSFLMVSRKEDLVDAPGDPDSLFWKVDFIHKNLPGWLRPHTDRRKLHFGNEDNNSTIDGESTTAAAGVGGRRTAMFIDEFSRIEEGYQLLAGTADTTRCRIFNFTPYGTSNAAYKLARREDVRKLRLHWSEHPEKARGLYRYDGSKVCVLDAGHEFSPGFNFILDGKTRSPWYDGECERRANDREVAQMLDIDYQSSAYQFFDNTMITQLQMEYGRRALWEGNIQFDEDTAKPIGLVKVKNGPLKLWIGLDSSGKPTLAPYGAGVDICSGSGATNSCLALTDSRTGEKVLEYADPFIKPDRFARLCVAVCRFFLSEKGETALLAWEMQGPGRTFGDVVISTGFRNIYYRQPDTKPFARPESETPGWYPSPDNKRALLEEYRAALSTRDFLNRSVQALEECRFFVFTSKGTVEHAADPDHVDPVTKREDPSGAGVNHGDRVIADALSWKMARSIGKVEKREKAEEVPVLSLAWRRARAENADAQEAWL